LLQKEKTGEREVLRPGAKDGTWVDPPGGSVVVALAEWVRSPFRFVGGAREHPHSRLRSREQKWVDRAEEPSRVHLLVG
jgi:hypothetical protein